MPALILHGGLDRSMPVDLAERMHAGIPGSLVELVRGSHTFFLFAEPPHRAYGRPALCRVRARRDDPWLLLMVVAVKIAVGVEPPSWGGAARNAAPHGCPRLRCVSQADQSGNARTLTREPLAPSKDLGPAIAIYPPSALLSPTMYCAYQSGQSGSACPISAS